MPERRYRRKETPGVDRSRPGRWMWALLAVLLLTSVGPAHSAVFSAGPDDYQAMLTSLAAGDTLVLNAGVYRHGISLRRVHGTPNRRITIEGPKSGDTAVFLGRPGANTVSLFDTSYVTLRDLVLDGARLPVDAVKAERGTQGVHHVTLERLTIVGHNYAQDIVGISTKCPAWGWVIRDNVIIGAGTGIYLGNSDGSAPFFDGVIEGNLIVDSIGYNLQIKHQLDRIVPTGAPSAPTITRIRNNVFVKARNGATGELARPNVLVGHFPRQGQGSDDRYEIASNVFFDNPTEALLQGEGNLDVRGNLFYTSGSVAVAIQPHHDVPRSVNLARNFVAAVQRGIWVTGGEPGSRQVVVGNEVYAGEPLRGGDGRDNITGGYDQARQALGSWLRRGGLSKDWSPAATTERLCGRVVDFARFPDDFSVDARHPACAFLLGLQVTSER